MQTQRSNSNPLWLALAVVALLAAGAAACDGDDSTVDSPSPVGSPGITPVVTPGSGVSPIQAVGTYVATNGLDGHALDLAPEAQANCPIVEATPTSTDTPGTPTPVSRLFLGQFCITISDFEVEESATALVELPDTDEAWQMKLEFDNDDALWKVKDVDKTGN
jgi:hypothetical protein